MENVPSYYALLSEEEQKNYIAMLMSKGCLQQWVAEEAERFGLKFLSEFYEETEKGKLL